MKDVRTQAFAVKSVLPSLNELLNAAKARIGGARKYNALKITYQTMIAVAIRQAKIQPCAHPVALVFDWYEPNRRRDLDNIAGGGTKLINDALVACGILKNDGQRHVQSITHNFFVDEEHPGVGVAIVEQLDESLDTVGAVPTPQEAAGDEALRPASGHSSHA